MSPAPRLLAWLVLLMSSCAVVPAAGAAAQPLIFLVPEVAGAGESVAVYGRGFCGEPSCSTITLSVGSRVAASDVPVAEDGTFSIAVSFSEPPGTHAVVARQTAADGSVLEATANVGIAASDPVTTTTTPDDLTTAPPPPPADGTTTTTTRASSTTDDEETSSAGPRGRPSSNRSSDDDGTPWVVLGGITLAAAVAAAIWLAGRRRPAEET